MSRNHIELETAKLDKQEHAAIKALSTGTASEHQQLLALEIIVKKFSRMFEMSYIPGASDASAFLAGRGFVGQQITKYINLPLKED